MRNLSVVIVLALCCWACEDETTGDEDGGVGEYRMAELDGCLRFAGTFYEIAECRSVEAGVEFDDFNFNWSDHVAACWVLCDASTPAWLESDVHACGKQIYEALQDRDEPDHCTPVAPEPCERLGEGQCAWLLMSLLR